MKILYVAPYPSMKSGVAYYAYNFKNAIEHCLNIQIDLLDIYQNENIYTINKFLSLSKKIRSLKTILKYNIIHFEIGGTQNREFYMLYFIKKYYPLKDADIMVLPYRKQNNFSLSGPLIQGMSYGLPIIASDVKNFSNDIEDGRTGILFEDGNVKMLAEKIKLLIDDRSLRKKLGENAQNHIFKEHNPQYISNL